MIYRISALSAMAYIVLAIGSGTVAIAAAEPKAKCEPNGTTKTLTMVCVQNKAEELLVLGLPTSETIRVLGTKEPGTEFSWESAVGVYTPTCTGVQSEGLVLGAPMESMLITHLVVEFTGCTEPMPEHCELEGGKIRTELLNVKPTSEDGVLTLSPMTGRRLGTFTIGSRGGTCLAEGTFNIEGRVSGTLSSSGEDMESHILGFEGAEGLVLTGGITTKLTLDEDLTLDAPATWNAAAWVAHPPWGLFLTETIP